VSAAPRDGRRREEPGEATLPSQGKVATERPQGLDLGEGSVYPHTIPPRLCELAAWCFRELNPRTRFALNWHFEVMAGKLAAVYHGRSRRLIVSLPPRHLKSHLASVAFPAWCLGHDPSAQIVCVAPGI
jgi:hypothetical protein